MFYSFSIDFKSMKENRYAYSFYVMQIERAMMETLDDHDYFTMSVVCGYITLMCDNKRFFDVLKGYLRKPKDEEEDEDVI